MTTHIIALMLMGLALAVPPIVGEPYYYGPRVWVPIATQGERP